MSRSGPVGIGIIGAGMISDQYLANLSQYPDVQLVAIGDLSAERAASQAAKYDVPRSGTPAEVLTDDATEIVINLTIPAAHVEISAAALEAGKHVWSEKPIGIERDPARSLLKLADERGLLIGVAPDTVLGPLWQSAKRAIMDGVIGVPLSATTAFQSQGPDWFHPDPGFLFAKGAGPLFDMGPYYLSALVHLLGPIQQVVAVGTKAHDTRIIRSGSRAGTTFPVEVPTHISILSRLTGGVAATSLMSTDTALSRHGIFEVNGTEATMVLGDPNYFGGVDIRIYRPAHMDANGQIVQTPELITPTSPLPGRGIGALTMARTIRGGGELHVASGELGYHVLDVMTSIEQSIQQQAFVDIETTVAPIAALPADFDPFEATLF